MVLTASRASCTAYRFGSTRVTGHQFWYVTERTSMPGSLPYHDMQVGT